MLKSIKNFYEQRIKPAAEGGAADPEHALRLATAALLIEMMRADFDADEVERRAVTEAVRSTFGLSPAETAELVQLAEEEADRATSLHGFTSLINERFSRAQKIRVIELLWRVAYADRRLESHEQHLMRKLARLLHVSHKDYIAAKFRARDAVGAQ